jgi:ubiquinone/menaquinone biosynthesis C-methylase UbiE
MICALIALGSAPSGTRAVRASQTPSVIMQVLDLGCGVGGPAREICRFSRASVTGVNNNGHQITRARQLTKESGPFVEERCNFVQSDFMKLPFEDSSYDHAYAIEATCHAPDPVACYKEIARCIKPGGMFVCYEWVCSSSSSSAIWLPSRCQLDSLCENSCIPAC